MTKNFYSEKQNRWVLYRSAAYLGGLGATFGDEIIPHATKMPNVSSINIDVMNLPQVDVVADNIKFLKDDSLQHFFVGHRLAVLGPTAEVFLKDVARKIKVGGHLVVNVKDEAPSDATVLSHGKPVKQASFTNDSLAKAISAAGRWKIKAQYVRDGQLLHIYKKLEGRSGLVERKVSEKPRACIARYGALGDMIILTPLIRQLAEDGFEVTMNASPYCLPVINNNPHVHNLVVQEREMIPNPELGDYWAEWQPEYHRYINLSESLEGKLLKVEGRREFFTTKAWRIETGNKNYYDYTLKLGGYENVIGKKGELFFSNAEERKAKEFFDQYKNKFVVVWALNGSSHHKIYPSTELVIEDWLLAHPDSVVVTVGDNMARMMEFAHQRLIRKCGEWSVRDSLIAAKYANLVIGPESMMTNAAGCFPTPKIVFMSHSSPEALSKYWDNCINLEPQADLAPCYPCFQLHYSKESCPISQIINSESGEILAEGPRCTMNAVHPTRVLEAMESQYRQHFKGANLVTVV